MTTPPLMRRGHVVVFDLYGVLVRSPRRMLLDMVERSGAGASEATSLRDALRSEDFARLERGEMSAARFSCLLRENTGVEVGDVFERGFVDRRRLPRDLDTLDLARAVAAVCPTALMTNNWKPTVATKGKDGDGEDAAEDHFVADLADYVGISRRRVFESCRVGARKPERRMFDTVRDAVSGDDRPTMVLVDDRAENIAAAEGCGWRAVRHRQATETGERLSTVLGIDVPTAGLGDALPGIVDDAQRRLLCAYLEQDVLGEEVTYFGLYPIRHRVSRRRRDAGRRFVLRADAHLFELTPGVDAARRSRAITTCAGREGVFDGAAFTLENYRATMSASGGDAARWRVLANADDGHVTLRYDAARSVLDALAKFHDESNVDLSLPRSLGMYELVKSLRNGGRKDVLMQYIAQQDSSSLFSEKEHTSYFALDDVRFDRFALLGDEPRAVVVELDGENSAVIGGEPLLDVAACVASLELGNDEMVREELWRRYCERRQREAPLFHDVEPHRDFLEALALCVRAEDEVDAVGEDGDMCGKKSIDEVADEACRRLGSR